MDGRSWRVGTSETGVQGKRPLCRSDRIEEPVVWHPGARDPRGRWVSQWDVRPQQVGPRPPGPCDVAGTSSAGRWLDRRPWTTSVLSGHKDTVQVPSWSRILWGGEKGVNPPTLDGPRVFGRSPRGSDDGRWDLGRRVPRVSVTARHPVRVGAPGRRLLRLGQGICGLSGPHVLADVLKGSLNVGLRGVESVSDVKLSSCTDDVGPGDPTSPRVSKDLTTPPLHTSWTVLTQYLCDPESGVTWVTHEPIFGSGDSRDRRSLCRPLTPEAITRIQGVPPKSSPGSGEYPGCLRWGNRSRPVPPSSSSSRVVRGILRVVRG